MITVKKFFAFSIFTIFITASALAQKVTVSKDSERVKGSDIEGYAVELNGTYDEVSVAFTKYIKSFSKVKAAGNVTQLSETQFKNTKYASPFYAITRTVGDKASAWMGLNPSEWPSQEEATKALNELESVMHNFGVKFYRDKIQLDVDEAARAQQTAEKQQLRLQNDNKNLNAKLEFNQKEKLRLEKALIDNKTEYGNLLRALEQNKKDQDSVAIATEQIKKRVEFHKERQKKVE
jgi:hypothetical protein